MRCLDIIDSDVGLCWSLGERRRGPCDRVPKDFDPYCSYLSHGEPPPPNPRARGAPYRASVGTVRERSSAAVDKPVRALSAHNRNILCSSSLESTWVRQHNPV